MFRSGTHYCPDATCLGLAVLNPYRQGWCQGGQNVGIYGIHGVSGIVIVQSKHLADLTSSLEVCAHQRSLPIGPDRTCM